MIGLREFQEGKADIIHKYTTEEARNLQSYGELPASAKINQTAIDMAMDDGEEEEDMGFDFDEVSAGGEGGQERYLIKWNNIVCCDFVIFSYNRS